MAKKQNKIYSVTQTTALIKSTLEAGMPSRMIVSGQISGFKRHTSGHCYFALKDEGAILPCVMWKSKVKNIKFNPENGMAALATGHIDIYEPSGKYQFYADKLEPAGIGDLQLAFEQMVTRLAEQGLFSDEHKKPIPAYPMRIGLLTSASGAAVMDISDSIYNRWPCAKLMLYPVPVQGEGAAKKIADALIDINKRNKQLKLDVIIVGRGGGSLEDLWAFNEEVLARAIYASTIPVISAVGHEVDMSISDLVADARASTPTKAGVIAVPDIDEVLQWLCQMGKRLQVSTTSRIGMCSQQLETARASSAFKSPQWLVNQATQQVDESAMRLAQAARNRFARLKDSLTRSADQIRQIEPHRLLGQKNIELGNAQNSINNAISKILAKSRLQLTAVDNRLGALDPKSVLARGYSITTSKETGKVVTGSKDVQAGQRIVTEFADHERIESQVVNSD